MSHVSGSNFRGWLSWLGFKGNPPANPLQEVARPYSGGLESAVDLSARRIRVLKPSSGKESFNALIRNLSLPERVRIEAQCAKVSSKEINRLIKKLEEHHFDSKVFSKDERYPYIALEAVKKGRLSEGQFATIMFFWALKKNRPGEKVDCYPLFREDGQINSIVRNAILASSRLPEDSHAYAVQEANKQIPSMFATPQQIDRFFTLAKELPPSEQCLFIFDSRLSTGPNNTILEAIRFRVGLNFFDEFFENMMKIREMLPSYGALQLMVQAIFEGDAIAIRPGIGPSPLEEIESDANQRDIGLPFPGVILPKTADDLDAPTDYHFLRHDAGYHALVVSAIPLSHRKTFLAIGQEIKALINDPQEQFSEEGREILAELEERLADMDFPSYRPDLPSERTREQIFWGALEYLFEQVALRLKQKEEDLAITFKKDQIYKRIAMRILPHINISIEGLSFGPKKEGISFIQAYQDALSQQAGKVLAEEAQ